MRKNIVIALLGMALCAWSASAQRHHHPTLTITTNSLPGATQGQAYSAQFTVSGGIAPYTWAVVQGVLPAGLTLSTSGLLSGTPTAPGTYNFTVQVTDSTGASARAIGKVLI